MHNGKFDLVIAGGGLAGLTLALECARRPFFQDKKIALLDREHKEKNDRTWCFWATEDEILPPVIFKTWHKCRFFGKTIEIPMQLEPFRYHMVRGIDFYRWANEQLAQAPHIERIYDNIVSIEAATGVVQGERGMYQGDWVLNSALTTLPLLPEASALYPQPPLSHPAGLSAKKGYTWMLQHFKGWIIETPEPVFDPEVVTFMDYRPDQHGETRFVYVLPFSRQRALVEFTVFSGALCSAEEYDAALQSYLREQLNIRDFTIEESEFGVIPMSDYPLAQKTEGRLIQIGTVGGFVKASSGYAFKRTQRKIRAFADAWEKNGAPDPHAMRSPKLFRVLDSIMLRVLNDGLVPGHLFFTQLFQKLKTPLVYRFLDEDATFAETLRLLATPPTLPFLKGLWRQRSKLPKV